MPPADMFEAGNQILLFPAPQNLGCTRCTLPNTTYHARLIQSLTDSVSRSLAGLINTPAGFCDDAHATGDGEVQG